MVRKPTPQGARPSTWRTVERIAQANVLIGVCLGAMLRVVSSWQRDGMPGEPVAPLPEFLFFVVTGFVALVGVVIGASHINDLPRRWQRLAAGAITVLVQFILFQVLMAYIG
ncbi:MAG: hypothetical protein H0W06_04615 [Chloroflexia bacterium]|nr:hypothetical protein [Chloroflexia bacterium]